MLKIAVPKLSNIPTWFQLGSNRRKTSGNGIFPSHDTCVHGNDRMELKFKKNIGNLDKMMWAPSPPSPPHIPGFAGAHPLGASSKIEHVHKVGGNSRR